MKNELKDQKSPPPFLGKLYWHGEDEHVVITESDQTVVVQGVQVQAQVEADGRLKLLGYEQVCDKDKKHKGGVLHSSKISSMS